MRKLILLFLFVSSSLWLHAKDFTQYVSPLVGTQSTFELSTGNTYPAIARPWGMNFWTPQTGKMGDGWQYVYTANKIRGFKQTHQPSPWINDYGQFSIMPVVGKPEFDEEKRASWFSHKAKWHFLIIIRYILPNTMWLPSSPLPTVPYCSVSLSLKMIIHTLLLMPLTRALM